MDESTLNENSTPEEVVGQESVAETVSASGNVATSGDDTSSDQGDAQVESDLNLVSELVQKLTTERDQLQEQVLRTMADFQNFRKRNQAESLLLRQFATQALIEQLLPVMDNFERTMKAADNGATQESLLNGIRAVERQLKSALESQGLQRLPAVGEAFDANLHEAIATVSTADHAPDTIVDEVEAGYKISDKIIRPAKVRVAVAP